MNRYQIIHISHAIYFITEPMAFLRRARARLADGGLLAVVISDFLAAYTKGCPGYVHSFYPCGESMRYALAVAGLRPILTRNVGGDIYIAARPDDRADSPAINTRSI